MQSTMNQKACCIRRPRHVPSYRIAVVVNQYHITSLQQGVVPSQRICPEGVRVLWVANADVARHTLRVALSCEDAEGEGHVFEHPLTVLGKRLESWDAGK